MSGSPPHISQVFAARPEPVEGRPRLSQRACGRRACGRRLIDSPPASIATSDHGRKPGRRSSVVRNQRGMMLLESLVAIGLLAIGMTSLSALMVQHIRAAGSNNLLTTAIALGEQELEDLRSQDYNTGLVSRTSTSTLGTTTYTITSTVTANSPAINMKSITTNVTWTGLNGSQTYALNTIFTQLQN